MTDPGDGPAPDPPGPERPSRLLRATGFLIAMLGIVLVAITPNPPQTLQHWLQIIGGAALTASLTTYAGWYEIGQLEQLPEHVARLLRWLRRRRVAVAVATALTAVLAFGVPPAWELARGISSDVFGCPPATQLRMVAGTETITTARRLAGAYERWTAAQNHDCPTVDIYAYPAATEEIRARMADPTGWSDESDAQREIGPTPDIWLTATSHELLGLTSIADSVPIALSPVVLAVPAAVADQQQGRPGRWAELFRGLVEQDVAVVRADPASSELGRLATALLYGLGEAQPAAPQQLPPAEIERNIAADLDEGGFPLTDTAGLLCRLRLLGSQAAVVASEQLVVRFNRGDPLGPSCLSRTGEPGRLVALYPPDTRGLDHQFVRLSWSRPAQAGAAAEFGAWLRSDPGKAEIVATGLRPTGTFTLGPALATPGVDPAAVRAAEPMQADRWAATTAAYDLAQRRARVLFLMDTSGSMATRDPEGTRWTVAADAVTGVLRDMGPRDEFGLWFFPGGPGNGHVEALPLGPEDPTRLDAAQQFLGGVRPSGDTPLFRAMIDAAGALGGDDPARLDAVVVLTDGEDTSSGLDAEAVSAVLADSGVRLIVVTLGEIRCSDVGLATITTATAGDCLDADLTNLDMALRTATAGLWGGR